MMAYVECTKDVVTSVVTKRMTHWDIVTVEISEGHRFIINIIAQNIRTIQYYSIPPKFKYIISWNNHIHISQV